MGLIVGVALCFRLINGYTRMGISMGSRIETRLYTDQAGIHLGGSLQLLYSPPASEIWGECPDFSVANETAGL